MKRISIYKRAAGIVVLMACALSGWAQVAVGAIEGSGGASGLGGATYTIPIKVPEGLGDIQPSLAVAYNSQGGNGLLGWCWDLQGTSAITRMGTTQYHDGEVSGVDFVNDRFALDGQRLVCVSGSYDGNGAEYRTESDGMAKIVSYRCDTTGGAACFKVWLPNGNIAYYGYTEDSRIGLQQRHNVCLWLLNRLEDRNGNAMDYQYVRGGASYRLSRIDYGGNDDAGIPYSYSVRFHYSTKDDREISFIGDNILVQDKRLDSIRVMHGSTELHKYLFDYHVPDPANGYYYTRLHQVRFVCGGESYNPTVVQWGQTDYGSYGSGQCRSIAVSGGSPSDFSGKIKFPGDFNGDGYTDFILYYPNLNGDKKAVFFINQGETTLLSQTHPLFVQHASDITLPGSIDWIYTADINGDGLDDILLSSRQWVLFGRDRLNLSAYLSSVGADGSYSFSPVQQSFGEFRIKKKYKDALYAGDFLGEGKQSFLLQECEDDKSAPRLFYITYSNGSLTAEQLPQNMVLDADRMFACDFNGDGKSEIYFMNEDTQTTGLLRIRRTSTSYLYQSVNNYMLSPWHQVFPGDFNGDGKPDLLTYVDDGNGNASWHINYFKESELYWPELPFSEQAFGIGDPKTHGYSLKYFDDPDYKFITVGDFNGDGKADVAVRTGNDEMKFLYGPVKNVNGQGQFSSSQTVSLSAIGMSGASNQSFCVGNFLGRENMSMFSASTLHALNPVSNRYSVVHVTDGMGNRTAFEYDYLMPKPTGASDADFYTRTMQTGTEQAADMFTVSLPMKALSRMTSSNIHCTAPAGEMRYRYGNAVVHKKGRGFLGFKSMTAESWLSSEKRQTVERLSETLTTVPSLALHTERARRSDGAVVSLTVYDNDILLNRYPTTSIHKAFVPVVRAHTTFKYDPGHPQLLLSKTVTKYAYNDTLVNSSAYGQVSVYGILKQTMARQGVDTVAAGYSISSCEFQTITQTTYMSESPSDLQDWIVNRPRTVKTTARRLGGYPDVMALTVNRYPSGGTANPFLPVRVDSYPGGVESALDSLATYDSTAYSATGSVAERYMGDVMGRLPVRHWSYGYSADGRFMTRQVDPAADTTTYAYDSHYGHLISETDCNGLATTHQSSPLGTSFTTHHPDRRVTQGGVSWDGSDPYAPYGAYYLKWSSTTGGGLGKTYYDAAGRKLRTLTQGMDGDPILKDFEYNDRGLLYMESLPYYLGDAVYWTEYKYDDYDRTLFADHPDGMSEVFWYNGPVTTHLRYLDDPDDPVFTTTTVNAVGWTVNSTDENGNSVVYDYNADGKLRTTQLGSDAATAVWIDYDAAGNRIVLEDPNYGGVRSVYDAYGQLILTVNPTGEDTSYEYDLLGRMVKRRERNRLNNTIDSTVWTYSEYPGKKGLLEYVSFNGKQQVLWYLYDTLCRVSAISEMRGTDYFDTRYAYDTLSRVTSVTYPSGYTMRKEYTATGHLRKLRGDSGELLWETLSKNAMGQVTGYTTGDGMATERRYDLLTGRLTGILTHNSTDTIQNLWYVYDKSANLTSRTDSLRNTTERFTYDRLDRLTGVVEGTDTTGVFVYDDYGRMTSKRIHGAMVFDQALFEAD
nr:FG-GAP-like repeat-containing protein [Bacteroidales bacterium]